MVKVPFTHPALFNEDLVAVSEAIKSGKTSGCGPFTEKVQSLLEDEISPKGKVLLTTSCTHALEITAILLDLSLGDEIIVPSYTFVSSALAFHMHGAKIIFADIRKDTLNIDESKLEELITSRTRAVVVVHYAGVACEMKSIQAITNEYNITLIEDNAHGLFGRYQDRKLGSFGDIATQSFHETKNISCGEGGALILNNNSFFERADIIRDKGTNRAKFLLGQVDKYSWVDKGSSYVLSDVLAALLHSQLLFVEKIQEKRKNIWKTYDERLRKWSISNGISLPFIPESCKQTYHMFYMLCPNFAWRNEFIGYLATQGISATSHYQPLHTSEFGKKFCLSERDVCPVTSLISETIVRLPMFYDMSDLQLDYVIDRICEYKP
jgi:dTDP-4-amino-4,6-dideoxygalactose transaminase